MIFHLMKCPNWQIYDIKGIESIKWKGSIDNGARELNLTVANNGFVYDCGDIIVGVDEISYVGQIMKRDLSDKQPKIDLESIDYMIHLENSKDTMVINSTVEGVVQTICNKLGIMVGSVYPTGIATGEQIFKNKTYYDIIKELYDKVEKNIFQIYMQNATLCVRKKGRISGLTSSSVRSSIVISFFNRRSVADCLMVQLLVVFKVPIRRATLRLIFSASSNSWRNANCSDFE